MTPLSGVPPEDKNTVSRVDNSRSEYFFRFLQGVSASSSSSPFRAFVFFAFSPGKKNNLNTSYNIFVECVLLTGIGFSGGFEVLHFFSDFLFHF